MASPFDYSLSCGRGILCRCTATSVRHTMPLTSLAAHSYHLACHRKFSSGVRQREGAEPEVVWDGLAGRDI